jgi:hypothetical protein
LLFVQLALRQSCGVSLGGTVEQASQRLDAHRLLADDGVGHRRIDIAFEVDVQHVRDERAVRVLHVRHTTRRVSRHERRGESVKREKTQTRMEGFMIHPALMISPRIRLGVGAGGAALCSTLLPTKMQVPLGSRRQ